MHVKLSRLLFPAVLLLVFAVIGLPQDPLKRNGRPQALPSSPRREEDKKTPDTTRYSYEFSQPKFITSHIVIEHDALGRGKISFERKGEATPIVEPIELSTGALGRIFGLWNELGFLDSTENYQASKNFAHLGTYRLTMDDGKRKRTAEFNWSNNASAWNLTQEYRRVADQADRTSVKRRFNRIGCAICHVSPIVTAAPGHADQRRRVHGSGRAR